MMRGCLQVKCSCFDKSERIGDHLTEPQHLAWLSLNQPVIIHQPPGNYQAKVGCPTWKKRPFLRRSGSIRHEERPLISRLIAVLVVVERVAERRRRVKLVLVTSGLSLQGPAPEAARRRGTPAGGETAASRKGGRPLSSIATQKLPICLTLPTPPTWGER